jgi:hypothetical protein
MRLIDDGVAEQKLIAPHPSTQHQQTYATHRIHVGAYT